jgi:DNA-directed RNA polymerase subunit RPC12/RpoP
MSKSRVTKPATIPLARCKKCGSTNLKDTGSFLVEIYQCQDCGELFCEDSGGVDWEAD